MPEPPFEAWMLRVHPEDRAAVREAFERALASAVPMSVEARLLLPDGTLRWIRSQGQYEGGSRRRFIGTNLEITERVQAERAAADVHEMLVRILDNAPLTIFVKDLQGRYVLCNPHGRQLAGLSEEEIIGKTDAELFLESDAQRFTANDADVLSSLEPKIHEEVFEGAVRPFSAVTVKFPLFDSAGRLTGLGGIVTETTQLKELELALRVSHERFRRIFDQSMAGIVQVDLQGRFIDVNRRFTEITGYPAEELLQGMGCNDITHPEDVSCSEKMFGKSLEDRQPYTLEKRYVRKDGSIVWVRNCVSYLDLPGAEPSLIAVSVDITDGVRAIEEARRLATINQATSDFVAVSDLNGKIVFLNDAGRRMLGLPESADLSALNHKDFCPEWVYQRTMEEWMPQVLEHGWASGDGAVLSLDGREIPVSFVMLLHRDKAGRPEFLSTVARDITESQEAQRSLQRLADELDGKVRQRTADLEGFAYSIAHDMRQHIRGLTINAQMIEREAHDNLQPDMQDALRSLVAAAKRMNQLTDSILTHARSGMSALAKQPVDLSHLVCELALEIPNRPHCNPMTVIQVQPGLEASADPVSIRLALENLLDNACKFSSERPQPVVKFGFEDGAFFVSDNGVGFEDKYHDRIFRAFERLDQRFEGTGLGLANVKRTIERHGGRVWAESAPGEGTTFWFTLPA